MRLSKFPSKNSLAVISFFLVVASPLCSSAFLNIESIRQSSAKGFLGSTGLSFLGESGNTDKIVGELSTLNAFKAEQEEFLGLAKYKYGENSKVKDTNEGNIHLRYAVYPKEMPVIEGFSQVEFNEFKDLDLRTLMGGGLRFAVYKTDTHFLNLGTGAFYEWEQLKSEDDEETLRGNLYISYLRKVGEELEASLTGYYQPSLKDMNDYRIQGDFGVSVELTELLSLKLEVNVSGDSKPPGTVKTTDASYLAGLNIDY